ncbi:Hypothetical predicted protein [Olea europaea subsp. europaea]|uniref:Uncharacterized protein n=1 Tax=Olea europaea subsp. europaea TaxID=158383 RepID=A0A8S0UA85_OLEEU|nr:Hypothetical predicted protein [Olea europaea subsp. europaea]
MGSGMNLEDIWHAMYLLNEVTADDVFGFIESAISIALVERPDEFRERKLRIARLLYGDDDDTSINSGEEADLEASMGSGLNLEDIWRAMYLLNEVAADDVFDFIESAISIASLERPDEFRERRLRIARLLYGDDDDDDDTSIDSGEEADLEDKKDRSHSIPKIDENTSVDDERNPHNIIRIKLPKTRSNIDAAPESGKKTRVNVHHQRKIQERQISEMDMKFVESKRKLEERYEQLDKSRSKIQILDTKNLPRQDVEPKKRLQVLHCTGQKTKRQSDLCALFPNSKFSCDNKRTRPGTTSWRH